MRESVTDIIFEIFVRSANQAFNRKQSSAILFSINAKELKNRNVRGFLVVLYLYRKYEHINFQNEAIYKSIFSLLWQTNFE